MACRDDDQFNGTPPREGGGESQLAGEIPERSPVMLMQGFDSHARLVRVSRVFSFGVQRDASDEW
jgi:hypothetical protein